MLNNAFARKRLQSSHNSAPKKENPADALLVAMFSTVPDQLRRKLTLPFTKW